MGNRATPAVPEAGWSSQFRHMDADELRRCRRALGLSQAEFALALRLPLDGGRIVGDWESGRTPIPGPVSLAIEYLLYLVVLGEPLPPAYSLPRDRKAKKAP